MPEELAEDEPRFIVRKNAVGAARVMYPTEEPFVKGIT